MTARLRNDWGSGLGHGPDIEVVEMPADQFLARPYLDAGEEAGRIIRFVGDETGLRKSTR